MKRPTLILLLSSLSFFVASRFIVPAPVHAQSLADTVAEPGEFESETMTRGPLHEAFAEQVNYDARPGITIRKRPPESVEEIPPDIKPSGNNIEWISGYWAWDDDLDDFLWVSGVWRDVPPDRTWVPGYWARVDEGYQWIAGFWQLKSANEIEYLPYPPASLERGPTSPSPSASHFWVSGCWRYQNQRYLWQPGFWGGYQNDWVWTPSHYVWTPRGAIYTRGYWDYPLPRRGVLFAPVYFPHYANYQRRYQYSPSVVINLSHLLQHLFVQPGHHHYYWGDYYGDRYRQAGYQANFAFHGRGGYDPLFNYYNIQHRRQGIDYTSRLRDLHISREHDQDQRPPRTWSQQQTLAARAGIESESSRQLLAKPLRDTIEDRDAEMTFRQVDNDLRESLDRNANQLRELSQGRNAAEANSHETERTTDDSAKQLNVGRAPLKLQLPKSDSRDQGFGGRVKSEPSKSPHVGSSGARTTQSVEHTQPDRGASSEQAATTPQVERSDILNETRTRSDSDHEPRVSPRVFARPEPATKQAAAQPNWAPQNRVQDTPEHSTVAPSAQPKFQLDLPKTALPARTSRQIETPSLRPSPQPSFSGRQPDTDSSHAHSAPRVEAKPEIGRQFPERLRQNTASPPKFAPPARATESAPNSSPRWQPQQGQRRTDPSPANRANAPNISSSGRSKQSAPESRGEDNNGRSNP